MKIKSLLVVITLATALCGCHNSEELVFTDSGNVSAVRYVHERFPNLLLGTPENPYSGNPTLSLQVPGWNEIQIGKSLEGELLRLCKSAEHIDASGKTGVEPHPGRHPGSSHGSWGKDAEWVFLLNDSTKGRHIDLIVRKNTILGLSIYCAPGEGRPIEVRSAGSAWQSFPLDRAALTALFGRPKESHQWMAE